jgi:hypothetical protein
MPWHRSFFIRRSSAGDTIRVQPGVCELQASLQLVTPGVTLRSALPVQRKLVEPGSVRAGVFQAPGFSSNGKESFQRAHLLRSNINRFPLHAKSSTSAEVGVMEKLHNVTAPKACRISHSWNQADLQAMVLSCVSLSPSGHDQAEVVEPLATAINVSAPDIRLIDFSIFGCTDTAATVHAERVLLMVHS